MAKRSAAMQKAGTARPTSWRFLRELCVLRGDDETTKNTKCTKDSTAWLRQTVPLESTIERPIYGVLHVMPNLRCATHAAGPNYTSGSFFAANGMAYCLRSWRYTSRPTLGGAAAGLKLV